LGVINHIPEGELFIIEKRIIPSLLTPGSEFWNILFDRWLRCTTDEVQIKGKD